MVEHADADDGRVTLAVAEGIERRAIAELQAGRATAAVGLLENAIAVAPRDERLVVLLGELLVAAGRHEQAIPVFTRALALRPEARAWIGRGIAYAAVHRTTDARRDLEKAVGLVPAEAAVRMLLARVQIADGAFEPALAELAVACRLAPALAEAWLLRGLAAEQVGDRAAALGNYETAVALGPDHVPALVAFGNALSDSGDLARARRMFAAVTQIDPSNSMAWASLGMLEHQCGESLAARAAFTKALAESAAPVPPSARVAAESGLLDSMLRLADWTDYDARLARLVALAGQGAPVGMGVLLAVSDDPRLLRRAAEANAALHPAPEEAGPAWSPAHADRRIRIAYVSSDLRTHPVAALAAGLLERHDAARFEVAAFSLAPGDGSDLRARLERAVPRFVDASGMSDAAIAEGIAGFGAEVCVDLNGHTAGARPGVLARRPAPVIVGYLGYAGPMGRLVDYTVVDRWVVPPGSEAGFDEALAFLPNCFQPNDDRREPPATPPVRGAVGLPRDSFVFCCFNHASKINPPIFDAWMAVLRAVPSSLLWLPDPGPAVRDAFGREAERRGVPAPRLVFAAREPRHSDHLARLQCADLFLDTHPYNAHASASDALWAGVPILTLAGRAFHARVAGSLLSTVGLPELVVPSIAQYVATAIGLAKCYGTLEALRARVAAARASSPLFDTDRTRRAIEAAFAHMVARQRAGLPAATFAVHEAAAGLEIADHAGLS